MAGEIGRRERKKQLTRQLIRDAALALFAKRGFDAVTVAEIAREADVSEATVFNHFPTKEDLVFGHIDNFEQRLLDAVRDRPPGQSALTAYADFVLSIRELIEKHDAVERIDTYTRLVAGSPALLRREHEVFAHHTAALAGLLADETDARAGDLTPWVVAYALIGLHRSILDYVRQQAVAGRKAPNTTRSIRNQLHRAVTQLEQGLGNYAIKPSGQNAG